LTYFHCEKTCFDKSRYTYIKKKIHTYYYYYYYYYYRVIVVFSRCIHFSVAWSQHLTVINYSQIARLQVILLLRGTMRWILKSKIYACLKCNVTFKSIITCLYLFIFMCFFLSILVLLYYHMHNFYFVRIIITILHNTNLFVFR